MKPNVPKSWSAHDCYVQSVRTVTAGNRVKGGVRVGAHVDGKWVCRMCGTVLDIPSSTAPVYQPKKAAGFQKEQL